MQNPMQNMRNMNVPVYANPSVSQNLSDRDWSRIMGPVSGSGGLLVNFFYSRVVTRNRNAEHNGKAEVRLCVSKQPRGDRSTVACSFISEDRARREYPEEFAAFKDYGEVVTQGIPLHELPGINMSQIGMLAMHGIRSIEDLAGLSEDVAAQLGLEATRAHKTARAWLASRDGSTELVKSADAEARYTIENKTLRERTEKQDAAIRALEMQLEAMRNAQNAQAAAMTGGYAPTQHGSTVQPVSNATAVDSPDDGETYDVSKMDDPFSEGSDFGDMDDTLVQPEVDPLSGA